MNRESPRPRRPIFLDGGRPIKPTLWRTLWGHWISHARFVRPVISIAFWIVIAGLIAPGHWIVAILIAVACGLTTVIIWERVLSNRELKRLREEAKFLVWFDRVSAIAAQYDMQFFVTPVWRQCFREGLTPEQAFERAKAGADKAAAARPKDQPKIRIHRGP